MVFTANTENKTLARLINEWGLLVVQPKMSGSIGLPADSRGPQTHGFAALTALQSQAGFPCGTWCLPKVAGATCLLFLIQEVRMSPFPTAKQVPSCILIWPSGNQHYSQRNRNRLIGSDRVPVRRLAKPSHAGSYRQEWGKCCLNHMVVTQRGWAGTDGG